MSEYDTNPNFFKKYSDMPRSIEGLKGFGEWTEFRSMLPDFTGKKVLDLGCGYGYHCKYVADSGASSVVGVDGSRNMIQKANEINGAPHITYQVNRMQEIDFPEKSFDVVISSMAFHYLESFSVIVGIVKKLLKDGGEFTFIVCNPIFTSYGTCDWYRDENGKIIHWPLDRYFDESIRHTRFLDEDVVMHHRTLSTYINTLIEHGFQITNIKEPKPDVDIAKDDIENESRRPRFLAIASKK